MTSVTDSRTNTTQFVYNQVGQLVKTTFANGTSISNEYDLAGRLTKFTDPAGHYESHEYDAAGNRIKKTDRLGLITQWQYDALNRMTRLTDAKGHQTDYSYDSVGHLTNVVDHLGNAVSCVYDDAGRLTQTIGPRGGIETRTYNKLGQLLSVKDPLNRTKTYEYDPSGNLTNFVAADTKSIKYTFDGLGRMTQASYPDFTSATYTYDSVGNLLTTVDGNGTTSNSYDELNRLVSRTDVYGKTVGYEYDANGNVTAITYPDSKRVEYQYDSMNRMIQVEDWLTNITSYTYDNLGNLAALTNANSTRSIYTYDDHQRLISLRNEKSDSTLIAEQAFVRDNVGNIIREQRNYPVLPTLEEGDTTCSYDIADQLQNVGSTNVVHDDKGNITTKGSETFTYDYANRITQYNGPESGLVNCSYDNNGNRIARQSFTGQRKYTLDVNRNLVSVLTENDYFSGSEQAHYVYGLGLVSRITPSGTTRTYHYDAIGSTLALTDESGNVTDSYAYDPFGKILNSSGSSTQPYRFVGQYGVADEGCSLLYMRARYYDVQTGRFLSQDPVAHGWMLPSQRNRFAYVANRPLYLVDPSGETGADPRVLFIADWLINFTLGFWEGYCRELDLQGPADFFEESREGYAKVPGSLPLPPSVGRAEYVSGQNWGWGIAKAAEGLAWTVEKTVRGVDKGIDRLARKTGEGLGEWYANATYESIPAELISEGKLPEEQGSSETTLDTISPGTGGGGDSSPRNWAATITQSERQSLIAQNIARKASLRARGPSRSWYTGKFGGYMEIQARMQASIDALTRGRGWESLSGQHGLQYSTASARWYGSTITYTYLSGYWYWNVSRCVELATPKPTFSTWLAAHAAQHSAVRDSLAKNYTANGINTPWIPEVYEAYLIDGKFAVYGK